MGKFLDPLALIIQGGELSALYGIRAWTRYQENTLTGRSDSRTRTAILYAIIDELSRVRSLRVCVEYDPTQCPDVHPV